MNINILYEDEEVIVCEKPAGVAAQTRRLGQADMESLLKNYRAGKGEQPYIGRMIDNTRLCLQRISVKSRT